MPVTGNKPPPYHEQGLDQCIEQIRQSAAKGMIICREIGKPYLMAWFSAIEREAIEKRNRERF